MPTNLPPECTVLEKKYLQARRTSEKIETLQKYLSAIPKHKGTERLCARLKTRLARLRLAEEETKKRRGSSYLSSRYTVKKGGAAQIVILGFTGSGKSSILKLLTGAKPEIYGYPFTTTKPIPGMMAFEDIQIQLVEAPALFAGASKGSGWGPGVLGMARNADGLMFVIDLSAPNPRFQLETLIDELDKSHITIMERRGKVEIERKESGGIQVVSLNELNLSVHDVKHLMNKMKIDNAVVKIRGDVALEDITQAIFHKTVYKPTIVLVNKIDVAGAERKLRTLREAFTPLTLITVSAVLKLGVENIPQRVYEALKIIRVYTKRPRQPPVEKPMIMREQSTVGDAAKMIHKDFYNDFKYARLWGSSMYPGERVGLNRVLQDKDVLEFSV
jgi:ribosome-interacting GTPase 1